MNRDNQKKGATNMKLNYILVAILCIIVLVMLVLRYTIFKNFNFLPLISFLVILEVFIVSYINIGPNGSREILVEKGIGFGGTLNPRNPVGFFLYILLFIATLAPYFL